MRPVRLALLCWLALALAPAAPAQFLFTRVVDTTTTAPGGGPFTSFTVPPSISGGTIAFLAGTAAGDGVYVWSNGTLTLIADGTVAVPGGTGNFSPSAFPPFPPGVSGSNVAFGGGGSGAGNSGVYTNAAGPLTAVVNTSTPFPLGGSFTSFSVPSISGSTVAFEGGNGTASGVFTRAGTGPITTVASTSSAYLGGSGFFTSFGLPVISGANVAFRGFGTSGQVGLFLSQAGSLSVVANTTVTVPGTGGAFTSLSFLPSISGNSVAFYGAGGGRQGVYLSQGGTLSAVADTTTPVPGGAGTFASFTDGAVSVSNGRVAFVGTSGTGVTGVYTDLTGSLTKVLAAGDAFDGKTVASVSFGHQGLDGATLAVAVAFTNNTSGIYTFSPVPEPAFAAAVGFGFVLRVRRRTRGCPRSPG